MTMVNPKISVIVPVYKAEAYLHRCIDSILAQTFKDFELLLIDDGSPDRSGEICDEYARKDCRVKVHHKSNGGVSSARQYGLDNAIGEYVIHADPDDWIDADMYEKMYDVAVENNADIVGCDFCIEYSELQMKILRQPFSNDSILCLRYIFEERLHSGCCNKLIKRMLFVDNHIKFPCNINLWEDMSTIPKIFYHSRIIKYIPHPFYHYVQYCNINSYTKSPNPKVITQKKAAIKILEDFFSGTVFIEYLNYLKLSVRLRFIYSNLEKESYRLYPEADEYIFNHQGISLYNKLILWIGIYNYMISNILIYMKNIASYILINLRKIVSY